MRAADKNGMNLGQFNITDSLKSTYDNSMVAQMSAMDKNGDHHAFKVSGLGPMYSIYDHVSGNTTDYKLALDQDVAALESDIEKINDELDNKVSTITFNNTKKNIDNAILNLTQACADTYATKTQLATTDLAVSDLSSKINLQTTAIGEIRTTSNTNKSDISSIKTQINTINSDIQSIDGDIEKINDELDNKVDITLFNSTKNNINNSLLNLNTQVDSLNGSVSNINSTLDEAEACE